MKDHNPETRKAAATALGKIGHPTGIPPLLTALADDHAEVREAAARGLASIHEPSVVDGLIKALEDDSPEVVEAAAASLGAIGDPLAIDALAKVSLQGEHRVRTTALVALGMFDDPRTTEPLMLAFRDKRYDVRKAAMEALIKLGTMILPSLEAALTDDEIHVRRAAVATIGQIADAESVWALMRCVRDPDPGVRRETMLALGRMHDPQVVDAVIGRLTSDENEEVRAAAASALGSIADPRATSALLEAARNPMVEQACLEALLAIVQTIPSGIADQDLLTIARMKIETGMQEKLGALAAATAEAPIDFTALTHLACQELQQRGVQV